MVDLLFEKRKIVIIGKTRRRKRIPETRDTWEEAVTKTADAGVGEHNTQIM